jgi:outer membrane immunogenic protein
MKLALGTAAVLVAMGGVASAADLPVYREPQVAYIAPAAFSWTGLYAGASVSYGIGRSDAEATIEDEEEEGPEDDINIRVGDWWSGGALLGGHVGYQMQFGAFVVGAELAAHWSGVEGDDTATITGGFGTIEGSLGTDLNWLTTARLKAGVAFDRALIYGIGGLAYGDVENSVSFTVPGTSRSWSNSEGSLGWTLGAGLEYAITDNWIIGAEYQHVELGDDNTVIVDGDDFSVPVDFQNSFDLISVRASYKF